MADGGPLLSGAGFVPRSKEAEDGQQRGNAPKTLIDTIPDLVSVKIARITSNAMPHFEQFLPGLPGSES